ncbi:MAG: hypothetical protein L3K09_09040, partial [Thermoplasmata archaeon]|nr:hypothetical protein [Thermoplasmata archaeon]
LGLEEAQGALTAREWGRATAAFAKARAAAEGALESLLKDREEEVRSLYARAGAASAEEAEAREEHWRKFRGERERKSYVAALEVLREEGARATEAWRLELIRETNELKERLWVVEKLGLDTTPVMELFSEAQIAIQTGKLEPVYETVTRGRGLLEALVRDRLNERRRAVESEVIFARDALNVTIGPVAEKMEKFNELNGGGRLVAAAQVLLEAEEELNRRKALHRELLNIHYLIDAALGKAAERHLDATEARKLLDESIHARATDYALALEKAREAHKALQALLQTTEPGAPPAGFWPFKRAPGT